MSQQKTNTKSPIATDAEAAVVTSAVGQDVRNAVLIVSVVANLFFFTAWVMLQVTSQYDSQLAGFIFG
jgi:hypothetical protein